MNLIEVMERFRDQESCIEHLERIRWRGTPICPHCESQDVAPKNETQEEGEVGRTGRYNCHVCRASFKVTCGTVFHHTKIVSNDFMIVGMLMFISFPAIVDEWIELGSLASFSTALSTNPKTTCILFPVLLNYSGF